MKKFFHAIGRKKLIIISLLLVLALAGGACFVGVHSLSRLLPSQLAAERWQGDSEQSYTQISCFIPVDESVTLSSIATFREAAATKLHEAAVDIASDEVLMTDAWSCSYKVSVSSALGKGEVYATAVGGEFFTFHPIRLISGSYITSSDLMQDRVLLDEDTAWLLFGGTDIQGLSMKINGVPFIVAGVIEREEDYATQKAYTDGMGIFISYDAYGLLSASAAATAAADTSANTGTAAVSGGEAGIQCYEFVMADPVKNFALSLAKEKFPIGRGEIVDNTSRFKLSSLWALLKDFDTRSMQTRGIIYPYWENAARGVEDRAALLMLLGIVLLIVPAVALIVCIVRYAVVGKQKLEEDVLPRWKDGAEEAVRVRARRRWEKKHNYTGEHEK